MTRRVKPAPAVTRGRSPARGPRTASTEWAGTRLAAPPELAVRDVPALDFILWMDGPDVVAAAPVPREAPRSALVDVLRAALASPKGPPPQRFRVSDAAMVPDVVALVGPGVPVTVGPVPAAFEALAELAEAVTHMMPPSDRSPLDEIVELAETEPALVARFFAVAADFYRLGPWRLVPSDSDVLRVDAPALGLRDACVSIVGQLGESFGALCFDSAETFMAFQRLAETEALPSGAAMTNPPALVVNFEAMREFPPAFRRDFRRRRWALAGPAAVPWLMCSTPDGTPRPVTRDDVSTATALLEVLTAFLARHGRAISDELAPCLERYEINGPKGKAKATVEHPHPAYVDDDEGDFDETSEERDDPEEETERATARFMQAWEDRVPASHAGEVERALREMGFALLGRELTRADGPGLSAHLGTSLLPIWASLFRPRPNGRTGLDDAAKDRSLADAASRAARLRLSQARVIFADVLAVDRAAGTVLVEDVFDRTRYTVLGWRGTQLGQLTRWARGFGLVLPRADGRWIFPSVFSVSDHFARVDPGLFAATVRATLAALKKPVASFDPAAPAAGLRLHWGIAYGVLVRMADEMSAADKPKRTFMSTSEGDCLEYFEAVVTLKTKVAIVTAKMRAAKGAIEVAERQWDRLGAPPDALGPLGEALGSLTREGSRWVVRASSAPRLARMYEWLEAVLGERPKETARSMRAPWQDEPDIVRTKEEADETLVVSSQPLPSDSIEEANRDLADLTQRALRDALDREVPAAGGVPRQRVATPEGRAAVEAWLRDVERRGLPPDGPTGRMLDLDPMRRELGLPTVV